MMSSAANWQLDRLSASAREAAEIASLGAGLSLSAWLTRMIGETCAAEGVAPPSEPPKILEFTREARERTAPPPARSPMTVAAPEPPRFVPLPQPEPAPARLAPAAMPPVAPPVPPPIAVPRATRPAIPLVNPIRSAIPPAPPRPPQPSPVANESASQSAAVAGGAAMLPIAAIAPANLGTRRGEDVPEALLADIATRGVRQPILVRRAAGDAERYEIVCGHRRWRAAQRLGLSQIAAVVGSHDDAQAILASLAENLQLANFSPIDEAQAYLRLLTQCAVDISAVTAATGRDRPYVVRSMRLLGLPPLVRHLIGAGSIARDHAYVLLDAPNPEELADAIIAEHLSVEATRQRIPVPPSREATP